MVRSAWKEITLTPRQRRAVKVLAQVALDYGDKFDKHYDKVAEDTSRAVWDWFGDQGRTWKSLGFPMGTDPRLALPFLLPHADRLIAVGGSIESTFYDFWYLRTLEGTKPNVRAAFRPWLQSTDPLRVSKFAQSREALLDHGLSDCLCSGH